MKVCVIADCKSDWYAIKYCLRHYAQVYKHGKVLKHTRSDSRKAILNDDHALIPLGVNAKDGYAVVDLEYAHLEKYKWRKNHGRAVAWDRSDGKCVALLMHKVICPDDGIVDHVDGDPLNNRVCNLRIATPSQNSMNRKVQKNNKLGLKGVSWHKSGNNYRAAITINKRTYEIGRFKDPAEAAKAYNEAAERMHGDFARLNHGI